jgi:hypothetical protein
VRGSAGHRHAHHHHPAPPPAEAPIEFSPLNIWFQAIHRAHQRSRGSETPDSP